MKSLHKVLESILGDIDQELDVPSSIGNLTSKLKKLKFEQFYTMPQFQLYFVRPKDPHKIFYELWSTIQKDSASNVKNADSEIRRGENCTIISLTTMPDDKQYIIIYNPNVLEAILLQVRQGDEHENTPVLCAELQTGRYCMYAMDYMVQSRKKLLYKFPVLAYDLIKSSIA